MQQALITVGGLAGRLGFPIGSELIADGFKLAVGHALRDMLGKWTQSLAHCIV